MLVCIDSFKIYIIQQHTRSDGRDIISWGMVLSSALPDISRYADGTIKQIFIQGCNHLQDKKPLLIRNNNELCFVLNKIKKFCDYYKEPFAIVGGRIKLNAY